MTAPGGLQAAAHDRSDDPDDAAAADSYDEEQHDTDDEHPMIGVPLGRDVVDEHV